MAGDDDLLNLSFDGGNDDDPGEIVVQLPTDIGGPTITKVAKEAEPEKKADDPVEDLKTQFAHISREKNEVEQENQRLRQEAQTATQRAHALEGQVVTSQLDTVLSGIAAAEADATAAEGEYIAAVEAGDALAQARAQRKMAGAEARKLRLTEAKDDLEEAAKRRPREAPQPRQEPRRAADPVEAFIKNANLTPRSADFIRRNPAAATDPKVNARMMAAHNLAVADDIELESPEYFRRIEEGIRGVTKKAEPTQDQLQRRPAAPAAPAGGDGGGGAMGGGTEVKLTRGEATSATDGTLVWNYDDASPQKRFRKGDPIGVQEFAKRKYELQRQNAYDKSYTEGQ